MIPTNNTPTRPIPTPYPSHRVIRSGDEDVWLSPDASSMPVMVTTPKGSDDYSIRRTMSVITIFHQSGCLRHFCAFDRSPKSALEHRILEWQTALNTFVFVPKSRTSLGISRK